MKATFFAKVVCKLAYFIDSLTGGVSGYSISNYATNGLHKFGHFGRITESHCDKFGGTFFLKTRNPFFKVGKHGLDPKTGYYWHKPRLRFIIYLDYGDGMVIKSKPIHGIKALRVNLREIKGEKGNYSQFRKKIKISVI